MNKYLTLGVSAFALAACGEKPMATNEIQCGGITIAIDVYKSHIDATIEGQKMKFKQVVSASGARYDSTISELPVTLWNKGEDWVMIVGEENVIACVKKELIETQATE